MMGFHNDFDRKWDEKHRNRLELMNSKILVTFGCFKGKRIGKLPDQALEWFIETDDDWPWADYATIELEYRSRIIATD